jgi:hypothetical protein
VGEQKGHRNRTLPYIKRIIASYSLSLQELRTDEDFVVSMGARDIRE